jgi:hypothetical protein
MSIAATFPDLGQVHQLYGAAIQNGYGSVEPSATASAPLQLGRFKRITFWVRIVLSAGSAITSVKVKLQARYKNKGGSITRGWQDLPSDLGDAAKTYEVEHTYGALAANNMFDRRFVLEDCEGFPEIRIEMKADAAGIVGDSVTVEAYVGS